MKYLLPILFVTFAVTSCSKKNNKDQATIDEEIIVQYISDHNLNAIPTGTGLYYVIDSQGTGASCTSASTVKVSYTGYFTDGSQFDQSPPAGVVLSLNQVIPGWKEGIPYFREGGVGKLLIPSKLAYGTNGQGPIPPNTVVLFDVELLEVQ